MNSRDYKIFVNGGCYHIYNRGNNKSDLFYSNSDYLAFLLRLRILLGKPVSKIPFDSGRVRVTPFSIGDFSLLAYCLMPNHYHLLLKQNTEIGIYQFIHRLTTSYAKYFNIKHEHVGNVFQDTFKAKLVDNDEYLLHLSAYIHNNPSDPSNYLYSSLVDYSGKRNGILCDQDFILSHFGGNRSEYVEFVHAYQSKDDLVVGQYLFDEN